MPSKNVVCEFCNCTHRKDRLGQHVKVRHVKQLAEQFTNDLTKDLAKEENTISNIIHSCRPVRIYSKKDPKSFYIFGVVAKYFEENDPCDEYIYDNIDHHNQYLSKVLSHIPLSTFLKSSYIHGDLVRENRNLKEENERLSTILKLWVNGKSVISLPC